METEATDHFSKPSGDFKGHILPGLVCFIFGLLWTYNSLFRYHVARRQAILAGGGRKKLNYKNSLFSKYYTGWLQRVPFEAYAVLLVGILGFVGEMTSYTLGYSGTSAAHHILIHSIYWLMAFSAVLKHKRSPLPPGFDYALFAVANALQAFMLTRHLSGKSSMNQQMHVMWSYLSGLTALCVACEVIYKRCVTAALGRTLTYAAQGLWLCATGFIIHPLEFMPKWDQESHYQMDIVTSIGIGTIVITVVIAFVLNYIVVRCVKNIDLCALNRILSLTYERHFVAEPKGDVEYSLISDSDYEN